MNDHLRIPPTDELIAVRCHEPSRSDGIRVFPCEGEYPVYDDYTYDIMNLDETCEEAYLDAIALLAPERVVLDIGTGRDANWAIAAMKAGARHVYAVEELAEWVGTARRAIENEYGSELVTVLPGSSTDVSLPEPIDVCISEIIGSIGGSEGAAASILDARARFMHPRSVSIPERCTTAVAGISLDGHHPNGLAFDADGVPMLRDIFLAVGHAFDVRLCMEGPVREALVTDVAEVEEQCFNGTLTTTGRDRVRLTIRRACRLHGLALWPRLQAIRNGAVIDPIEQPTGWLPVLVPLFVDGQDVQPDDVVEVDFRWTLSDDGRHPDYEADGSLLRAGRPPVPWRWSSPHHAPRFRASESYRRLFLPTP